MLQTFSKSVRLGITPCSVSTFWPARDAVVAEHLKNEDGQPPRYIRHSADLAYFTTEKERQAIKRNIEESVDFAFGYVQARHVMAARR